MKKFFLIFFLILISFSCSSNVSKNLSFTDENTVKSEVSGIEQSLTWTNELEANLLKNNDNVNYSGNQITSLVEREIAASSIKKAVFPSIPGFGNLDLSALSESQKNKINDFCSSFAKNLYSGPEAFFAESYRFNYIFFVKDFINLWEVKFGQEFPFKNPEDERAALLKKVSSENEEEINKIKEMEFPPFFDSWTIGNVFVNDDLINFSVRFFTSFEYVDINLYLENNSDNLIYKISLVNMEKLHE